MLSLNGKVCVVTGSSGLIGAEICKALAEQGGTVLALYHQNAARVESLQQELDTDRGEIQPIQCDLRNREAGTSIIAGLLREHGRLDVLVCCAGETLRKSALLTSHADCDALFDLNFDSVVQLCRHALRPMFRQNGGRIILIGSRAGEHGMAGQSVYAASKAALHAYAKSLAFEVGEKNITVNAVAPGVVAGAENSVYSAADEARVRELIGLRRPAHAREIASVVSFLASPAAAYISGAVLAVDGAARF